MALLQQRAKSCHRPLQARWLMKRRVQCAPLRKIVATSKLTLSIFGRGTNALSGLCRHCGAHIRPRDIDIAVCCADNVEAWRSARAALAAGDYRSRARVPGCKGERGRTRP